MSHLTDCVWWLYLLNNILFNLMILKTDTWNWLNKIKTWNKNILSNVSYIRTII